MAPFRASRLTILMLAFAVPLAGCLQTINPVAASEPGSQLDALAYGAAPEAAKTPARAPRKSARSSAETPAAQRIPVIEASPSYATDGPAAFEENAPGLLAVLGFDNRRFALPASRAESPPLEAQAALVVPSPAPPAAPAAMEENAPGLLAAIGLDSRVAPPLLRTVPPNESYARIVAPAVMQPELASAAMPVSHGPEYRLGAGDKLRVVVFGQEGLTNTYSIDAGGAITMPLIGRVSARGHTPGALAEDITARLRKGFIRDPSVAVEIESYRPFFILGEVAAPGQYPYVPNMSVEAAVAIAGGFSPRARRDSVTVTHPAEGGLLRAVVPLGTPLSPGDTVLVSERWF